MEKLSSRIVYRNPLMTVREDEIRHADGSPGIFGVVEKPDFALVLPRWRDMIHRAFTDAEIGTMIRSGAIVDAPSLAALTLYRLAD